MMVEVLGKLQHNGRELVRCRCSCGAFFYALADDVLVSGSVRSCGDERAGVLLDRISQPATG